MKGRDRYARIASAERKRKRDAMRTGQRVRRAPEVVHLAALCKWVEACGRYGLAEPESWPPSEAERKAMTDASVSAWLDNIDTNQF